MYIFYNIVFLQSIFFNCLLFTFYINFYVCVIYGVSYFTLQWRTKVGGSKRIRYPRRPINYIKRWALNCILIYALDLQNVCIVAWSKAMYMLDSFSCRLFDVPCSLSILECSLYVLSYKVYTFIVLSIVPCCYVKQCIFLA